MRALSLIVIITFLAFGLNAQKQVIQIEKTFLGVFNQTRFSNRLGLWTDLHHRMTDDYFGRPLQSLGRIGLSLFVTDNFRITAGYCLAYNYPPKGFRASKIEHRPWQQLFFRQNIGKIQTIQILRLEERYNQIVVNDEASSHFHYTNRLRYNFLLLLPFSKQGIVPKKLFGVLNNEVFINFGKNVMYNVFDQNRFFAGLGYQISKHSSLHVGYMNIFQQQATGNKFENSDCIRLFFYHSLDLRKEKQ